jgi:hypothetical protein
MNLGNENFNTYAQRRGNENHKIEIHRATGCPNTVL